MRTALVITAVLAAVGLLVTAWVRPVQDPVPAAGEVRGTFVDPEVEVGPLRGGASPPSAREGKPPAAPLTRRPPERPALSGRLVGPNGEGIADAIISWSTMNQEALDNSLDWYAVDWAAVERETVWARSLQDGSFTFAAKPVGVSSYGTAVWASHPDHRAAVLVLESEEAGQASQRLVMQPAARRSALVVDSGDRPATEAVVRQFATKPWSGGGLEALARRVFYRRFETGGDGKCWLATLDREEALFARKGPNTSGEEVGASAGDVTLVLSPSFTASGTVFMGDGEPVAPEAHVSYGPMEEGRPAVIGRARVSPADGWGPVDVPHTPTGEYGFRLEGGGLVPRQVVSSNPGAGGSLVVDFETTTGSELWFQIVDEDNAPVPEALTEVRWTQEDGTPQYSRAQPRPDGYTRLRGCPPGELTARVTAPGFAAAKEGPLLVPEVEPTVHIVEMRRSGRLTGKCLFKEQPVSSFTIAYWPEGSKTSLATLECSDADGEFAVEDAPAGNVALFAQAPGLAQSQVVEVQLSPGGSADATLELRDALGARGRVVDHVTQEPIEGATIQVYSTADGRPMLACGTSALTDASGAFSVEGLTEELGTVSIQAAGHASLFVPARGAAEGEVDLGTIQLQQTRTLTVRLVHGDDVDPTRFSVASLRRHLPPTAFTAEGEARFEEVGPGTYMLDIACPDGSGLHREAELVSGKPWDVDVQVGGGCELTLGIDQGEPAERSTDLWADVDFIAPDGTRMWFTAWVPEEGRVEFSYIPCVPFSVKIRNDANLVIGRASGGFDQIRSREVEIRLGADTRHFRVVDAAGLPVSDLLVFLFLKEEPQALVFGKTDREGKVSFAGIDGESLTADLHHFERGACADVPVRLPHDTEQTIEIQFLPEATLALQLLDGDTPVPDLRCEIWMTHSPNAAAKLAYSGPDGRVSWNALGSARYGLRVSHPGYWPVQEVLPTAEDPHRVQVRRLGDLSIEVRDRNGFPVRGAGVELTSVELASTVRAWAAQGRIQAPPEGLVTDRNGELRLAGLPHGDYQWTAVDGGPSGAVTIVPGETSRLVIELP